MNETLQVTRYGKTITVVNSSVNNWFWTGYYPNWEFPTFEFLFKYWNKNKTYIDIGAWIGPIALIAADECEKVIGFEPDPIAYPQLVQNIHLNDFKNIIADKRPVSTSKTLNLGAESYGTSTTRALCGINAQQHDCILPEEIFEQYCLTENDVSIIKIDVEGHEEYLLQDPFLINLNIPFHISLHPAYIQDRELFFKHINLFFEKRGIFFDEDDRKKDFFEVCIDKKSS